MQLSFREAAAGPLLPALIGLSRAADASAREPDGAVFSLLREGLAQGDVPEASCLLARIRTEKARLIPGCAACASPCGRTADPTPEELCSEDAEVLDRKGRILELAGQDGVEQDAGDGGNGQAGQGDACLADVEGQTAGKAQAADQDHGCDDQRLFGDHV